MTQDSHGVTSPTKFISGYIKRYKTRFAAAAFWSILFVIVPMQVPILTGALIDGIHGKHVKIFGLIELHDSHKEVILAVFLGMVIIALLYGLAAYFRTTSVARVSRHIVVEIRKQLVQKLTALSLDRHQNLGSGELLNRAVLDTGTMRPFIENTFIKTSTNLIRIIYPVSMLFVLNPFLALLASSVLPVQWIITRQLQKKLHAASRKQRGTQSRLTALIKENLDGVETVQTSNAERFVVEKISRQAEKLESDQMATKKYAGMISATVWIMTSIGLALVWWQGGSMVVSERMTVGSLVAFTGFAVFIYRPSRRFTNLINIYQKGVVAAERIQEILKTPSSVEDQPNAPPLRVDRGAIEFRNVSFAYTDKNVLSGICLNIEPCTLTAIIGRNGSGKSSLLKLIVRLYDPTEGQVLIDDQNVRTVQLESLRSQIAVVPQSSIIFNGTVSENVRLSRPDATEKEVEEACETAGVLKFVAKWQKGLDTQLGVGGISPSGGEIQRIAIARAIIKKPKILLLDEPSSALDSESESSLAETLAELKSNMTIMLVSHRPKIIRNADKCIVIDCGRIVPETLGSTIQDIHNLAYLDNMKEI